MIIYLDFDGVLFDTVSVILKIAKNDNVDFEENCRIFFENLDWKYILTNAKELNDSISAVKRLKKSYTVKIITHVSSIKEMEEKIEFINKNYKNTEIVLVPKNKNKSALVDARNNILIDDSKKNIEDWNNHNGIGILYENKSIEKIVEEVI